MSTPPTGTRPTPAARAALEAQRAARVHEVVRAEELENTRRLQEAQAHQDRVELANGSADRARRDAPNLTGSGPVP